MKKTILLLLVFAALQHMQFVVAQTIGELSVSTVTSEAGGNYAPRNVLAIWVEDSEGNFIKTLMAYAQNRRTHLNMWQASTNAAGTEFNTTDAVTGATRNSHASRSALWDGTDFAGNLVPDGNYKLWFELTDKNNTGNFGYVDFTKNAAAQEILPADIPSFNDIIIQWQPDNSVWIGDIKDDNAFFIFDQQNSLLKINIVEFFKVSIFSLTGQLMLTSNQDQISLNQLTPGLYVVVVSTENKTSANKIIIQ
jgi:hypothetical protein